MAHIEEGVARLSGHSFVLVLPTQAELSNECAVGVKISFLQITEMPAALADHQQEASATVVIMLVQLQMLGEGFNPIGEHRDLNLR